MLYKNPARSMIALFAILFFMTQAAQAEGALPKLANVTILATGATIAGTGASRTKPVGDTAPPGAVRCRTSSALRTGWNCG